MLRGLAAIVLFSLASCSRAREEAPEPEPGTVQAPDRSQQKKIVAFGDSLTAGFGIPQDEAYPAALQRILDAEGLDFEVVNAGVSGETSAGGVRRLDWVLEERDVAVLVLALGGNDGLRGLPPEEMKRNLAAIIEKAASRNIQVLLAGMFAPPNQGERYTREFSRVFEELSREFDVAYLPFLLQNVAAVPALNQPDGIHPNAEGARVVAENVWEVLEPMLAP